MADTPRSPNISDSAEHDLPSTLGRYVGRTLDNRYQIVRLLGRGGMGSVFLARHVVLGRPLAVKVLNAPRREKQTEFTRLFREAQTAAQIGHPNIIEVLDVGVASEGHPYVVMEYLEGEDVASILRRMGPFSLAQAMAILEPVLLALGAAHARNIVHRDVKPANMFVVRRQGSPPTVKLIDFGIAKDLGPTQKAGLTLPGSLIGTPSYMPPEQATGIEDVDVRADIYGVGVSLYEILTGKLPFDGANYNETLFRIVTEDAPPPKSPIEELPAGLVEVVQRAMHKDPNARFQSAGEFLEALKSLEAWSQRAAAFEKLSLGLQVSEAVDTGIAATQLSPESPLARDVPHVGSSKPTSDFVETVADGTSLQPRQSVALIGNPWFLRIVVTVSLATMLFLLWKRSPEPPHEPHTKPSTPPGEEPGRRQVSITISDAPPGARVFYDGKLVTQNPFLAEVTNTVIPIRVEREGFDTFQTMMVPIRDTTIRLTMQPKAATLAGEVRAEPSTAPPKPAPRRAPSAHQSPSKRDDSKVQESGRGTFYTEKFE